MATERQIAANRENRKKWFVTEDGRRRMSESTKRVRPWEHSTGPKTPEGKARVAMNRMKHGRETSIRAQWRRKALRFLRLNRAFREALAGVRPSADVEGMAAELCRLAQELRDECPPEVVPVASNQE